MRKLLVVTGLLMLAGIAFGQTLKKGNIIGLHVIQLNLDPDVTYNQYISGQEVFTSIFNKEFQGDIEVYLIKSDRGDEENSMGMIWLIKSNDIRAKYFDEEGAFTELFSTKFEKVNSAFAEKVTSLGTSDWTRLRYNDWIIL